MFDILFGWRKASKCKKLIKRVQCRLKLLKNKRNTIVRQLREDIAELIKNGHEETAFNRVEQLINDESIATVYELLDHFCEFILIHLSYIRRHKDCPNDINEAISSLIFASARCGDLPELHAIRKLFGERYGHKFAMTAVELFPGNLVNRQINEKLSMKSVPDDLKYRVVDEIAREYYLQPELLALEYYSEWHQLQGKQNNGNQLMVTDSQTDDIIAGSEMHPSNVEEIDTNVEEIDRDVIWKDPSGMIFLTTPSNPCSNQDIMSNTSASFSSVQKSPPYNLVSPLNKKVEKVEKFDKLNSSINFAVSGLGDNEERIAAASAAESLPLFPEEMVVYLDEIEECHSSVSKYGCQDQRLFKFRSSVLPRRGKLEFGCDQSTMVNVELLSEKSGTGSSRKSWETPEKMSRRRSVSLENQSVKDVGCMLYYYKPCVSPSTHKHGSHYSRKQQRPLGEDSQANDDQKKLKQHQSSELKIDFQSCKWRHGAESSCYNLKMNGCSSEHPYYHCGFDDKDNWEDLPVKQKSRIRNGVGFPASHVKQETLFGECCQWHSFWNRESDEEMEWVTLPNKPRGRSYHNSATVYNVFTYTDRQSDKQHKEIKAEIFDSLGTLPSSNCFRPNISSSLTGKETLPPYSRAVTLPPEQSTDSLKEKILRTNSCPSQYPNHVHPKLPDYDDIAAKFLALKKEHLQHKHCSRNQQLKVKQESKWYV